MKLHLPKSLLITALATAMTQSLLANDETGMDITTEYDPDDEIMTVANLSAENIQTSGIYTYLNVGKGGSTHSWRDNLTIGDTTNEQNEVVKGNVDNVGAFDTEWNYEIPNGTSLYTNSLKVSGNVTVQGDGKIVLGGQNSSTYQGLTADSITLKDNAVFDVTRVQTSSLYVNISGTAEITSSDNCTGGNAYMGGATALSAANKQSKITESITLDSGTLLFGYSDNVQGIGTGDHRQNAFGSLTTFSLVYSVKGITITQNGGTMLVRGDSDMTAGSSITQQKGAEKMIFRDCLFMNGEGDTTFTQSADNATMIVGKFITKESKTAKSTYAQNITFNQTGSGHIHLAYGSNFANKSTIKLAQSGNGTIKIGGEHDTEVTGALPSNGYALSGTFASTNTTYSISQTGSGTVTVASNAAITSSDISIAGTLKNNGTINGTENSLLEIVGGKVENNGKIAMDIIMYDGELTATNGSTFTNVVATSGTIYLGDAVSFDSLTLGSNAEIALYTLRNAPNGVTVYVGKGGAVADNVTIGNNVTFVVETEGTAEDLVGQNLTIFQKQDGTTYDLDEAKLIVKDSTGTETEVSFSSNGDGTVNITGNIPEPATATLSLLALAALAARRRRAA